MYKFSEKSKEKLNTCEQDLQILANEVIKYHDCTVVWGHRNKQEQERMVRKGVSKLHYPLSKHNTYPSKAVDLVAYVPELGGLVWKVKYALYFAGIVLGIADRLYDEGKMSRKIRWGGNWSTNRGKPFTSVSFFDGYHFELKD